MRIAVDAMGGDHAPAEIIKGALAAAELDSSLHIILVGQEKEIIKHLPGELANSSRLSIVHCQEVIGMHEHPATAYRKKKDASITVATRLVKEKEAQAVVSAGSTGAQMVAALFGLGRLEGVDRPAILIILPTLQGPALLLDGGANADCKPANLLQFAKMGKIYAEKVLGMNNPRVGLINIGEEAAKGNDLTIKAYELLGSDRDLNFIGNIEGRDILSGKAEVMVCDGFVGNIALKIIEGTAGTIMALLKEEMTASLWRKIGALMLKPGLKRLKWRLDYAEYGGMPLLGVKGVSIICHGSSQAKAIKNAIAAAKDCVNSNFIDELQKSIEKW
ncbi:MAG: phosphate acyltransferase PlsX [Peptococcaceae bacterium]|jgi:glycerol-3-phosphate acyltransferase PlsX|nr:phosphate acyltransferase PlsX [Peptococcaceae bacterium]MDH7525470.1 phosphate acyltransferase PlsX [Peptococcaceae bacterium]